MVQVAAHFGASAKVDDALVLKVLAMTGHLATPRRIAAATLFHCWLLKGRPRKGTWQYRARVRYAADVLSTWLRLPPEKRAGPPRLDPTVGELQVPPPAPLN